MSSARFIDTHCHVHDSEFAAKYEESQDEVVTAAKGAGVTKLICVGTDVMSSKEAVAFSKDREGCYASVAIHPHEAADMSEAQIDEAITELEQLLRSDVSIVAIGECGLDYYYHDDQAARKRQQYLLEKQFVLAETYQLPVIFHIRNRKVAVKGEKTAFDDCMEMLDRHDGISGVVHSFSAGKRELEQALDKKLFIGLNGIMTFSKDEDQLTAAKLVPTSNLVLETDAPFLTPKPFRGKMCKPEHIVFTAEFLSNLRGESFEELAAYTTRNAEKLFGI